jgi:CRISPR system Cascade subunit CasB
VRYIITRSQKDKAIAAALRRADNPDTEYQSWEVLAAFHIDLEKPWQRLPYAAVAAAIAKAKIERNGSVGIGRGIASCYGEGNQSDQAKAKLRRLLACDSVEEACRILRPLFSLIMSKGKAPLDYATLLTQLLRFHWQEQAVKAQWAQDFYRYVAADKESGEIAEGAA